jgi:hypothetical protein
VSVPWPGSPGGSSTSRSSASTCFGCPPVYPPPHDDNGYHISDHTDIDPVFGTLVAFDELLAGVHARSQAVRTPPVR